MDSPETHDLNNQASTDANEPTSEANSQILNQDDFKTEAGEPIEESTTPSEQFTTIKPETTKVPRVIIGIICSLFPVIAGIISAIVSLDCSLNSKYLSESAAIILTVTSIASVAIPFACALMLSRTSAQDKINRKGLSSLVPLAGSLYLAYHTLTNDLGELGNAILLLSLISAAFFAFKMLINKDTWKILAVIGVFALGTAIIGLLYLDFDIELNSPFKIAVQFGAVALMLGTIADARAILSRIKAPWFIFFKSVASSLCLICAGLIFTAFSRGFDVFPKLYLVLSILYACYAANSIAETASVAIHLPNSDIDTNT